MNELWQISGIGTGRLGVLDWGSVLFILVVVLIVLGARKFPELWRGWGSGMEEFFKASHEVQRDLDRLINDELERAGDDTMDSQNHHSAAQGFAARFVVWLAQGFGIGRIPWAPGTFGSLLGLAWFAALLQIALWQPLVSGALFVIGLIASVWTCDAAEKILGEKDPGSIVLDEIIALPTCFLGWVFHLWLELDAMPSVDFFFGPTTWYLAAGVFLAFRFFDIVKPWPVKQSQELPKGWGVVMDDQLAAVYVNLVILAVHIGLRLAEANG
ncbi:MAG TPA: hypothetical protein DCY13_16985 [Verrucomicrobiales bacterium]|nr:hypothetical protein [Verrucomicrobiales bacterium]